MKNKKQWETKSLKWIHEVREDIDREIVEKGMTPAQWIKSRGEIDIESLCQRLGLKKFRIVKKNGKKHETEDDKEKRVRVNGSENMG